MMKVHKQKVIATFKVAHGIYYQARFISDGQPICVQFQKSNEYEVTAQQLREKGVCNVEAMLLRVNPHFPVYYCLWQLGESIYHFVTNRINEMLEHLTESGHDRICDFETDTLSIVERRYV
ncbi:hypothetical protein [Paenibacillus polymyxa]|uniref:hypothetical protein n=1 Tax=Paenibacillus polymyxa TaxID=1406 RepID=UPI0020257BBD|nr:hypothetical protein [Paenibacillus polymyxa]URJ60932.1 hypothetical protein MF622_000603 [Paenibacillus polymyxa]